MIFNPPPQLCGCVYNWGKHTINGSSHGENHEPIDGTGVHAYFEKQTHTATAASCQKCRRPAGKPASS